MPENALTVVVVEDEDVIRNVVEAAFTDAGYTVVGLATGPEALDAIERDGPSLAGLVTDIDLGSDLNGWDLAARARELNPTIAIVYMTGGSGHEWVAHGVPQSIVIEKPFATVEIVVALATLRNSTPV